jgi:uncharacterized protein YecE (DUF72 family)
MYRSSYEDRIAALAEALTSQNGAADTWCIFDNTASSAAASDALALLRCLTASSKKESGRADGDTSGSPPQGGLCNDFRITRTT